MLFSRATANNAISSPAASRRRGIAILLVVVLLALHSFGEAFHYRAHLPVQGERTSRTTAARQVCVANPASSNITDTSCAASDDDNCAFCALTATAARVAVLPTPILTTPAALALGRVLPPAFARIAPSCRPRAPGPPRAPPVSFA